MTQKQISDNIELDLSLKLVAESFTEVAAVKLQKIRTNIERNRSFYEEISSLFAAVKKLAEDRNAIPKSSKKGLVTILLSSNYKFYGGLERRTMSYYLKTVQSLQADKITIGQSAEDFFRVFKNIPTKNIIFNDDIPDETELKDLVTLISSYEKVLVFYPRFQSVLVQIPKMADLTESSIVKTDKNHKIDYIVEPEIEQMWQFFDSQILTLLLEQTFLESELARTAARLISMDQAQDNAKIAIKDLRKTLAAAKRSVDNNRILETESAMFAIRRDHD